MRWRLAGVALSGAVAAGWACGAADAPAAASETAASEAPAGRQVEAYGFSDRVVEGELLLPEGDAPTSAGSGWEPPVLDRAAAAFDAGEIGSARSLYEQLTTSADRGIRGYALYRLAWCEYVLQEFQGAMQRFVEVLALVSPPLDERERSLRGAAVDDLARVYAQVGRADRAEAFFQRVVGPEEVSAALEELADQYNLSGMRAEERIVRSVLRMRLGR